MFLRPWLDGFRFAKDEDAAAVADAPEADDAIDEKAEEAGDSADDGGAEAGDQVEAQQAESADPTDDDGDDDASPAQAAVFDHGIEGVPTSAEEFRSWHAEQQTVQQRARQEADQYRNQMLAVLYAQQQQAAAAQQAQVPAKQPEAWKSPWEIPQWDNALENQLTLDENGNVVTKPGAIPTLAGDYQKYQAAVKKANAEFFRDPASVIKSYLEHSGYLTKEQVAEQVKSSVERVEEQMFLQQETERNKAWALDENGQPTAAAQTWNQYYALLRQHGVPYRQAVAMSHKALGGDAFDASLSEQQTKAQKQAADKERQQTKVERNREVLRAANAPNRAGAKERRTRRVPSKFPGVRSSLETAFSGLDKSDFPMFN